MSSPIAIPRSHAAAQYSREVSSLSSSSGGSPTGLYIPIHKRGTSSVSSSPSTSAFPVTPQTWKSHSRSKSPVKSGKNFPIHNEHATKGASHDDSHIPNNTDIPTSINHQYSISDLFALAPQARLSPSQLEGVHFIMDLISSSTTSSGSTTPSQSASRRRRTGRKILSQEQKVQRVSVTTTTAPIATSELPRRRGIWGWNPPSLAQQEEPTQVVAAEESNWRHHPSAALVFSQA